MKTQDGTPEEDRAPPRVREKLDVLPTAPGVYKWLGADGAILYIGKAKNLRNRVRSYFNSPAGLREITRMLVRRIRDLDWIVTGTEKEALLLENSLIKEHLPFYNINLKDNKTYPFIKLTSDEAWPRAFKTRTPPVPGAKALHFGPYTDVGRLYATLDLVDELFPLKKCATERFPKNHKPCLYFHMGRCLDWCTGGVDEKRKDELVRQVSQFLKGRTDEAIDLVKARMKAESEAQQYERAAEWRDRLRALEAAKEKQQVVLARRDAMDVLHYHPSGDNVVVAILQFREGLLLNKATFSFDIPFLEDDGRAVEGAAREFLAEAIEQFLVQYYGEQPFPVEEILLPPEVELGSAVGESIAEVVRRRFPGDVPADWNGPVMKNVKGGDGARLLELAASNARLSFHELKRARDREGHGAALKELLRLGRTVRTLESFDIAHTGSTAIMAGMVRFADGQPDKANYRLFSIRSTDAPNDFASMQEAVFRRYRRLLEERKDFPDLILIDGGPPQLQAAQAALQALGVKGQPVVSLAKEFERVYVPKKAEPLEVPPEHAGHLFLIRVRDETHRFINGSHAKKRDKLALRSRLEDVPGIGPVKIKILHDRFDGIDALLAAADDEIASLPRLRREDVKRIREVLGPRGYGTAQES